MPVVIFGSIGLFFVIALIGGTTAAELENQGWLLGAFPKGTLWKPVLVINFDLIDWPVLWQQAAGAATIVLVSAVSLLLNASGLELNSGQDIELNRELQAAGAGNSLAGLAAGLVGFQGISLSTMNLRLGANSRIVGLVAAAICALVLILGGSLLSYFPKVVLDGLLLYLGLVFLVRWVYKAYFQLPKIDYFIVVLIFFIVAAVGYLEGVAVGILLAVVLFVVGYSRIDVLKHRLTGITHRSRVTRPINQREVLRREGARLFLLHLQGLIFSGTADNLLNTVRERANDTTIPKVSFVILDFRQVTGIDSTALLRFERMVQLGKQHGFSLIITEPSAEISRQLRSCGFCDNEELARLYPNLDRGIEWCENELLENAGEAPDGLAPPMLKQLELILPEVAHLQALMAYFERIDVEEGEYLMKQGDRPDSLYIIESGQVTAQLESPHRPPVRLETMGAGRIFGELGFYLGQERTAAIVVDTPGTVFRLTLDNLHEMERSDPEAASHLHQIVIRLLSERVTHLVDTVNALET
jgi:SulP family sulfate permease